MWEFHCGTLVFTLYFNFGISIVEINIKIQTFFKLLVSKAQELGGWNEPQGKDNFYEKHYLPVATWNKNNLSKQVVPMIYTLDKRFLQLLYFWKFASCFFSGRVKKLVVYFGLYESSLDFLRREDEINTV